MDRKHTTCSNNKNGLKMYKRFCALCGKSTEKLYNNICINCYRSKIDNIRIPSKISLNECKICGSLYLDNYYFPRKKEVNWEKFLKKIILKVIKNKSVLDTNIFKLSSIEINVISDKDDERIFQADITISRYIDDEVLYNTNKKIEVTIKYHICRKCKINFYKSKRVIIQIRAKNRPIKGEEKKNILKVVKNTVKSTYENEKEMFFIDIEEGERGSIDIKLNSKSLANKIVRNLRKKYPFSMSTTSKMLKSTPRKEEKYQTTIRLLLPTIKAGDIIERKKKYYFVKRIDKEKIIIISLENYRKKTLNKMHLSRKEYNIVDKVEYGYGIIISRSKNLIQLLDVKNYHTYSISLPFIPKEKIVKYILIGGRPFILPREL